MNDYAESNNLDVTNPAPRCPVILLLDTSGSMSGQPLRELQSGLDQFLKETSDDETASMSVELGEPTKDRFRKHLRFWEEYNRKC